MPSHTQADLAQIEGRPQESMGVLQKGGREKHRGCAQSILMTEVLL